MREINAVVPLRTMKVIQVLNWAGRAGSLRFLAWVMLDGDYF